MKNTPLLLILATLATPSLAQANPSFRGATSEEATSSRHISVHFETADPNDKNNIGKAAFQVNDVNVGNNAVMNQPVSFAKMDKTSSNIMVKAFAKSILGKDNHGVTVAQLYRMSGKLWKAIPKMPDHSPLGRLSYAKAGNLDVYFGDWADVPAGAEADSVGKNNTVFYSGTGVTTNLPTSGSATYAVKGINNHYYQGAPVLVGELKADFAKKTLAGHMKHSSLSMDIAANINTSAASFSGSAKVGNTTGVTNGHFFGDKGAAIAGIADFGKNHAFNTAFGGTKK